MTQSSSDARTHRKFTGENLPEFSQSSVFEDFELDAQAVVAAIAEGLQ